MRYEQERSAIPFGVEAPRLPPSFVVLDKSYLDAVSSVQLQYYAQNGWTFGVPEVLMFELVRKRDEWRTTNLIKLKRIQESLVRLPGIGEMFRAEARHLRPASLILRARRIELRLNESPSGEPYHMSLKELRATEKRTAQLEAQLPTLIGIWRSLGSMPELRDARPAEIPKRLADLSRQIRDDTEAMRQFYGNHRDRTFPAPEQIDEQWALFRWIQVYLVAGLDFFGRHGLKQEPNSEKLLHERLDLDYTIPALLVGGLACCEKRIKERFKLLRPDGLLLADPPRAGG